MKIITQNKKAFFDYEILDKIEAGIVLTGDEVKSLRAGHVSMVGTYAVIHQGEMNLINLNISPYSHAYMKSEEVARRTRKLLLHRRQINKLMGEIAQKGITIVPLKIYFNEKSKVKIELGLAKHKKAHVKKEDIKERDIKRQTRRELRGKFNY